MTELEQKLHNPEVYKIYIGQLPLEFTESKLQQIIEPLASIKQLKIIKGDNLRGRYNLFCYAFVYVWGSEDFTLDLIQKLQKQYPTWRMNIKYDTDKKKGRKNFINPQMTIPPMAFQSQPQHRPPFFPGQPFQPQPTQNQVISGQKPCNILVRQLWIGGIPEHFDKNYLGQLMAYYGIIEDIEMFPKFAFVKYKQVIEATTAFERAEEISQRLGSPQGFRIFFSDPLRRAYVVSNNYQFDRQAPQVPVLFIGFPPITSATIDLEVIRPVVEKFGQVKNEYMRKNSNSQNRSYFLFSFDDLRVAIRAKQELSRRKDLLGDKRAQLAVLLDESIVLKNRDLSHTLQMFQSQHDRRKTPYFDQGMKQQQMMMMPPPNMGMGQMYQNRGYNMPPPYPMQNPYYPNPYYYDQQQQPPPYHPYYKPEGMDNNGQPPSHDKEEGNNIHDFLKDVLGGDQDTKNQKKPQKKLEEGRQEDILSKLLGGDIKEPAKNEDSEKKEQKKERQDREPSWSGFLTWSGGKRVGVDGHSNKVEPEDYSINIKSTIDPKDMVLRDKNVMILEASNNMGQQVFSEYVKGLQSKVGVALTSQFLMYVMAKSKISDEIAEVSQDQLLVVIEKASTLALVKDKLTRSEDLA